jgi:hypothetical protein
MTEPVIKRPRVGDAVEFGSAANFWVEYPSGLVDLSSTTHLDASGTEPDLKQGQWGIAADGDRTIRVDSKSTALVVIDMQKYLSFHLLLFPITDVPSHSYFLHPDIRDHPKGLACVEPLLSTLPVFRAKGAHVLWVNWGLTEHELQTIPPALIRSFSSRGRGFGSAMKGDFGRLLMRGEKNADLYGPLHAEYLVGKERGTDAWIHKNRLVL